MEGEVGWNEGMGLGDGVTDGSREGDGSDDDGQDNQQPQCKGGTTLEDGDGSARQHRGGKEEGNLGKHNNSGKCGMDGPRRVEAQDSVFGVGKVEQCGRHAAMDGTIPSISPTTFLSSDQQCDTPTLLPQQPYPPLSSFLRQSPSFVSMRQHRERRGMVPLSLLKQQGKDSYQGRAGDVSFVLGVDVVGLGIGDGRKGPGRRDFEPETQWDPGGRTVICERGDIEGDKGRTPTEDERQGELGGQGARKQCTGARRQRWTRTTTTRTIGRTTTANRNVVPTRLLFPRHPSLQTPTKFPPSFTTKDHHLSTPRTTTRLTQSNSHDSPLSFAPTPTPFSHLLSELALKSHHSSLLHLPLPSTSPSFSEHHRCFSQLLPHSLHFPHPLWPSKAAFAWLNPIGLPFQPYLFVLGSRPTLV